MGARQRAVWERQFEQATGAVLPYVRTAPDGFQYIDPDAPERLVEVSRSVLSTGFAMGWMPAPDPVPRP